MIMFFRLVQIAGWIGLVVSAFTLWPPINAGELGATGVLPFWPWSAVLLLSATAGFLLQRGLRGVIQGRWQLWCFVAAFVFVMAAVIRLFQQAADIGLAAGPLLTGLALAALAIEKETLDT